MEAETPGLAGTLGSDDVACCGAGIRSKDIRDGGWNGKGFAREQFEDAWSRYLPPISPPSSDIGDNPPVEPRIGGSESVTEFPLSPMGKGDFPLARADVTDVTDQQRNGGGNGTDAVELAVLPTDVVNTTDRRPVS